MKITTDSANQVQHHDSADIRVAMEGSNDVAQACVGRVGVRVNSHGN